MDPADTDVDWYGRAGLASEIVPLARVEHAGFPVGERQASDTIRRVTGKQVPDSQLQDSLPLEAGHPQRRGVDLHDAIVARVEDQQGVVRLPEQAAGDLLMALGVHESDPEANGLRDASTCSRG